MRATVIWTAEDAAAAQRLLAEHEAILGLSAELAPVVDIVTRQVIA